MYEGGEVRSWRSTSNWTRFKIAPPTKSVLLTPRRANAYIPIEIPVICSLVSTSIYTGNSKSR